MAHTRNSLERQPVTEWIIVLGAVLGVLSVGLFAAFVIA